MSDTSPERFEDVCFHKRVEICLLTRVLCLQTEEVVVEKWKYEFLPYPQPPSLFCHLENLQAHGGLGPGWPRVLIVFLWLTHTHFMSTENSGGPLETKAFMEKIPNILYLVCNAIH